MFERGVPYVKGFSSHRELFFLFDRSGHYEEIVNFPASFSLADHILSAASGSLANSEGSFVILGSM